MPFPSSRAPRSVEVYISRDLIAPNYPRSLGPMSAGLPPLVPKATGQLTECAGEKAQSVEGGDVGLREVEGAMRKTINTCKEIKATTCAHARESE